MAPDPRRLLDRPQAASVVLVMGGALWGLIWLPVRGFAALGLDGAWPGVVIYGAAAVVLAPVIWWRRGALARHWRGLSVCGLFMGSAFSLYTTSLLLTEVVYAILLFYLTPIWGTLLGLLFLGERLTVARGAALALGLAGLWVVLGADGGLPWPRNLGDFLALLSGMTWAYGSLKSYQFTDIAVPEQVIGFVLGGVAVSGATVALGGPVFGGELPGRVLVAVAPWALLSAVYVLPMLFMTLWPTTRLTPGRVGLLLMSDIVVSVASAAAWAGEVFGPREAMGSALIIAAGFVEVLGNVRSER